MAIDKISVVARADTEVVTTYIYQCGSHEFDSCEKQNFYSGSLSGKLENASPNSK